MMQLKVSSVDVSNTRMVSLPIVLQDGKFLRQQRIKSLLRR